MAMNLLGGSLSLANHHEDALTVMEAELSTLRRYGASERSMLAVQGNLATTYNSLGRVEDASRIEKDVYSAGLKLNGEEHESTLRSANNYADSLVNLERFEEARSVLRKTTSVARRVLGEGDQLTLKMRWVYAMALYKDDSASLDDLREAVTILEDTERTTRRVFGGAHPLTFSIEDELRNARAALGETRSLSLSSVTQT